MLRWVRMSAFGGKADITRKCPDVCFSNRPVGVKRFQAIRHCGVDVARGLSLSDPTRESRCPFFLDGHLIRGAMVFTFFAFSVQKWNQYTADMLVPLISHSPVVF